jgi:DHA2 family multidrug resistance protein-like MFS transporter
MTTQLTSRQRWSALSVLCLAVLMVTIDNTIVNVALPTLSRELSAGTSGLQWIVDSYTLVFAGLLLAAGHLGDRFGRKRALITGLFAFGATSALAAMSDSLGELIGARALMGIAAALIFPATLALLTNIFTITRERVAAIGIWSAVSGIAVALGPVGGGWLLEKYSWHSVFWVNLPIAAITIVAAFRLLPESRADHTGRIDLAGVGLSIVAISTLVWTVIEGPQHGWVSPISLGGFAISAAALAAFIGWEQRVASPILNVRLFLNRRFTAASAAIAIAFFALFGFIFLITQFFQAVQGYSTLEAGVRTLPFAIVIGMLSPVAMALAQRFGTTVVVSGGLVLMSAGFTVASTSAADSSFWGKIITSMVLMAAGLALVTGPATEAIMGSLPLAEAGAGSAVNDTTREVGGTLGVAVMGSVLASIYGPHVHDLLAGSGLSGGAVDTASSSVTAGLGVAAQLPAASQLSMVSAVQDSFLDGLSAASWVAAGATLLGAVLVAVLLPARGAADVCVPSQASGAESPGLGTQTPVAASV